MFENPRRGRQARNFTTNVPKILDRKLSSEQIFSENCRWVPLYCLNSELHIIATALETQEQADNYCKHKFYPHWSVSHSSLVIFRSHVDMLYFTFRFFIVFVITRISLNRGSVPYILLYLWPGWRKSFVIPRTSLYRGSLNRGSTVQCG